MIHAATLVVIAIRDDLAIHFCDPAPEIALGIAVRVPMLPFRDRVLIFRKHRVHDGDAGRVIMFGKGTNVGVHCTTSCCISLTKWTDAGCLTKPSCSLIESMGRLFDSFQVLTTGAPYAWANWIARSLSARAIPLRR